MTFRIPGIILGILLLATSFCFGHGDREVAEDIEAVALTGYWIYNDLDKGYTHYGRFGTRTEYENSLAETRQRK